jgi:DNA/RNA endonuclease G (NUC1)
VFDGPVKTIGKNKVYVPTHVFKVVVNAATKEIEAYLLPNIDIDGQYKDFMVPIAMIERKAKINLLPLLRDITK